MNIETLVSAVLPSLGVSVIMLFFNRKHAKKERGDKLRAVQKRMGEKLNYHCFWQRPSFLMLRL